MKFNELLEKVKKEMQIDNTGNSWESGHYLYWSKIIEEIDWKNIDEDEFGKLMWDLLEFNSEKLKNTYKETPDYHTMKDYQEETLADNFFNSVGFTNLEQETETKFEDFSSSIINEIIENNQTNKKLLTQKNEQGETLLFGILQKMKITAKGEQYKRWEKIAQNLITNPNTEFDIEGADGNTIYSLLLQQNNLDLINAFETDKRFNTHSITSKGNSVYHILAEHGNQISNLHIPRLITEVRVPGIFEVNDEGLTVKQIAAIHNPKMIPKYTILEYLTSNETDDRSRNQLHLARELNNNGNIRLLLTHNPSLINQTDDNGNKPFWFHEKLLALDFPEEEKSTAIGEECSSPTTKKKKLDNEEMLRKKKIAAEKKEQAIITLVKANPKLKFGTIINQEEENLYHFAARKGYTKLFDYLTSQQKLTAELFSLTDFKKQTLVDLIIHSANPDMIMTLLSNPECPIFTDVQMQRLEAIVASKKHFISTDANSESLENLLTEKLEAIKLKNKEKIEKSEDYKIEISPGCFYFPNRKQALTPMIDSTELLIPENPQPGPSQRRLSPRQQEILNSLAESSKTNTRLVLPSEYYGVTTQVLSSVTEEEPLVQPSVEPSKEQLNLNPDYQEAKEEFSDFSSN